MNKEQILSAARKENKNHDLAEEHINTKAGSFAYAIGGVLCFLMMLLSEIFTGEAELSCAIVYLGMMSVRQIVRYRVKKDRWGMGLGILLGAITLAGIIVYICELAGAW